MTSCQKLPNVFRPENLIVHLNSIRAANIVLTRSQQQIMWKAHLWMKIVCQEAVILECAFEVSLLFLLWHRAMLALYFNTLPGVARVLSWHTHPFWLKNFWKHDVLRNLFHIENSLGLNLYCSSLNSIQWKQFPVISAWMPCKTLGSWNTVIVFGTTILRNDKVSSYSLGKNKKKHV